MSDTLKLRTCIKSDVRRHALIRGTLFSAIGACLLLYGAIFLPTATLQVWGIPLLCIGGGLMTWGLQPYRRLCQLENRPDEIISVYKTEIQYYSKEKRIFTIPAQSIQKLSYFEKENAYGIKISLKLPCSEKIRIHDPKFDFDLYLKKTRAKYGCELFLPYFSKRAFQDLFDFMS